MNDKSFHNQVKKIFSEALELEKPTRLQYLDEVCGDDKDLRSEVASLLVSFEKSENFIEKPAFDAKQILTEEPKTPQIIGNYKVIKEIGQGGMGVVYLAGREDEQFKKRVAIKLVKRGLDSEDVLRRFRNERQILASLHHPNIAQLLDGGTSEEGLPYFVMEYIEGLPLLQYCEETRLSTEERLDLFKTICSAVQHAHQNLVIHRDLKPNNILVTHEREVKLLDFGVAKFLNPELGGDLNQTQTQFRVMTPEYASPEQIKGSHITTSSDIYSLGVILYELLTNERPFKFEGKSLEQILQAVTQTEPIAPSSVVSRKLSTGENNQKSKIRNHKSLSGDLDNIVLMALRKEPSRRYKSVEQFAEDIQRHLKGLPVNARPNTFSYRAEKFIKRNWVASIGGGLLVLSLIGGTIISAWQAREAARERDRAKNEQTKSENLSRFMSRILQAASPEQKGKDAKIIDVLNDAEQSIETEFANQPEQKAQAYLNLGITYSSIQEFEKAESLLKKSLEICENSLPAENQITSATLIWLGLNSISRLKYDEAEKNLNRGIEMESKLSPNGSRLLAFGLSLSGELLLSQSKQAEAEKPIEESVKLFEAVSSENDPDYAFAIGELGRIQMYKSDPRAEGNLRKSISIFRNLPKHYEGRMFDPLMNLGLNLATKSSFDEGIKFLLEAEEIANRLKLPSSQFWAKNYLCKAYGYKLDLDKVIETCSESVKLFNPNEMQEGTDNVLAFNFLGLALTRTGKPQEGEPHLRKSLALIEKVNPNDEVFISIIKSALGENLLAQNKLDEAKPLIENTYPIIKAKLGDQHRNAIGALKRLVTLYEKTNNMELANKYRAELPQ